MDAGLLTWLYLPTAFLLGMTHALEPGHSKTVVAAYLISIKGTIADALALGVTVTITHTLIIFILAVCVLVIGTAFPLDTVQFWLELSSALLVIGMGAWLIRTRYREYRGFEGDDAGHHTQSADHELGKHSHGHAGDHDHGHSHGDHDHGHTDTHDNDTAHGHSHNIPKGKRLSLAQLIAFGFSGGIVPCPAALAILILAVGAGKPALGLATVTVFSIGLALALIIIGILVSKGTGIIGKRFSESPILKLLPLLSAVVVTALGIAMLVKVIYLFTIVPSGTIAYLR